jgi:hypothetical protein
MKHRHIMLCLLEVHAKLNPQKTKRKSFKVRGKRKTDAYSNSILQGHANTMGISISIPS